MATNPIQIEATGRWRRWVMLSGALFLAALSAAWSWMQLQSVTESVAERREELEECQLLAAELLSVRDRLKANPTLCATDGEFLRSIEGALSASLIEARVSPFLQDDGPVSFGNEGLQQHFIEIATENVVSTEQVARLGQMLANTNPRAQISRMIIHSGPKPGFGGGSPESWWLKMQVGFLLMQQGVKREPAVRE